MVDPVVVSAVSLKESNETVARHSVKDVRERKLQAISSGVKKIVLIGVGAGDTGDAMGAEDA